MTSDPHNDQKTTTESEKCFWCSRQRKLFDFDESRLLIALPSNSYCIYFFPFVKRLFNKKMFHIHLFKKQNVLLLKFFVK